MSQNFNLSEYMNEGIESIVKRVVKASLNHPKEAAFILRYSFSAARAKKKREQLSSNGEHTPVFLISSITSSCNLFCKGCYSRANKSCGEDVKKELLSAERWVHIFHEAQELGIPFILLAGGEPLLRRDVIESAAKIKEIMFPVFTNGTLLEADYIKLFDKNRNLVPILSIEGDRGQTNDRRGDGTYELLLSAMDRLNEKGILFGASVTVTTENVKTVSGKAFFEELYKKGCKALIFVEYVPVTQATKHLAPAESERLILEHAQQELMGQYNDTIFLSFPGDEKYMGGCLAAGRGFFHINADGSAEPCPFSPYSDLNLKEHSLREALQSPLFKKLNESGMLLEEHDGGCLLFQKENEVKELLNI